MLTKFKVLCQAWQLVRLRVCRAVEICMLEMLEKIICDIPVV